MYNFSVKTQSFWFFAYFSALFLAIVSILGVFNLLSLTSLTLDKSLLYSGLLFTIGAGFGLGSLDSNERNLFWKWKLIWLVMILIGLILSLSGIGIEFAYSGRNPTIFGVYWNLLILVGIPFLLYGTILFFSGMSEKTRESFGKLSILFFLLFLVGFIVGSAGFGLFFASDGGRINVFLASNSWESFTYLGIILGIISIIPLAYIIGATQSQKEKFHKLWIVWFILALIGIVLYISSLVEILGNIDVIGGAAHREGGLILSLVFQAPGFVFLLASTNKGETIKKFSFAWIILLLVGLVIAFLSQLMPKTFPVSTLGAGIGLVIIASGLIYKAISLDYSPVAVTPTARSVPTGTVTGSTSKVGFEIPNELAPEEKKIYIEMQRKTNDNWVVTLNNAAKQNKLAREFVTRKVQELENTNAQADSLISSILEQAKRSSRQSIFEQAMGEPSAPAQPQKGMSSQPQVTMQAKAAVPPPTVMSSPPPMSPPGPPMSPPQKPISAPIPPPSPSGPPMPPKSAPQSGPAPPPPGFGAPSGSSMPPPPPGMSAGPPKPPGMPPMPPSGQTPPPPGFGSPAGGPPKPPGLPPMPSGAAPPAPGAMPGAAPPMPGTQPARPPGAPGGDAVGTARSTSIAELRGEMLKELRRLRDIFNDEQK